MKFNEKNWELLGEQGFSASTHDANKCIAVQGGTPYVTSWDANANATVYKFNGSDWTSLGTPIVSEKQSSSQSLCLSSNGILYLTFSDWSNSEKATVFKYEESQWKRVGDAASLSNASDISIAISDGGIPYIAYRDGWSMRRTTVMKFDNATNVKSPAFENALKIYPNPGNGKFTIELNNLQNGKPKIQVTNQLGQIIFINQTEFNNRTEIDLSGKPMGVYFIHVKANHKIYSKTIIIRK